MIQLIEKPGRLTCRASAASGECDLPSISFDSTAADTMVGTVPDRHRAKCPLVSETRVAGGGGHPVALTVIDPALHSSAGSQVIRLERAWLGSTYFAPLSAVK